MKKLVGVLVLCIAGQVWGGVALRARDSALEACSKLNGFHIFLLEDLLRKDALRSELIEKNPQSEKEINAAWERVIDSAEDEIFKVERKRVDAWVKVFTEGKPADSQEEMRDIAELRADLINVALKVGLTSGFIELRGKQPQKATLERVFIQTCEAEARRLTREWIESEDRDRQASEARWRAVDRQIDRLENDEREEEMSRGARLLGIGIGLMGQGGAGLSDSKSRGTCHHTRDFVSGFHRTCYYQCISGIITSTVSSTEICPLTTAAP